MTPDSDILDREPLSTYHVRCAECGNWRMVLEGGICAVCLQPPPEPIHGQSPKWLVYDDVSNTYYDFHREDKAKQAARYYGTTARRIR